jgi:predicted MPP superfamily phosphohydrolase
MVKKIGALATYKESAFIQFTGDLVDGYLVSKDEMNLQYSNWKQAIQPFWHETPVYVGMGNHESMMYEFGEDEIISIDRFPFDTQSSEAVFSENFVLPENGPKSEDGAVYDVSPTTEDFPPYRENVYYYTYDNVAMIVLNSNYWYAPSLSDGMQGAGGNLHGYVMDNQLKWL